MIFYQKHSNFRAMPLDLIGTVMTTEEQKKTRREYASAFSQVMEAKKMARQLQILLSSKCLGLLQHRSLMFIQLRPKTAD